MNQPAFEFHVALPTAPYQGGSPLAIQASKSGAVEVVKTWSTRQSAYLQVLRNAGSLTDQEAEALLPYKLSSINSVRRNLIQVHGLPIVEDGHDVHVWRDDKGVEHSTKRTRWKLKR